MKIEKNTEFNIQNYSYLDLIEKNLSFYLLKDHYLTLCFDDIDLNNYKSVTVFLKNIKTREMLKCISKTDNNNLILNLRSLNHLCTNYEFSIVVILEDYQCCTAIYPKFKSNIDIERSIISSSDDSNINWYLRVLGNGKLRLSAIHLFTKIEKEYTSGISL